MPLLARTLAVVAACSISLAASLPARADMLYLVCRYPHVAGTQIPDSRLEIDLANKTVNDGFAVYPATISAFEIYYRKEFNNVSPHQLHEFLIDRSKGTLEWSQEFEGGLPQPKILAHCIASKTAPATKF
jgi:hypothetical protein